jgi:3-phenylpropionate/trans-cinnamate dioxygenase ferredoxin subunit
VITYYPAGELQNFPEARAVGFSFEGQPVAVVRIGDAVFAVENRCAHAGSPLDRGVAVNFSLTCPMHGARFDVRTGTCVNAPYSAIRVFSVRVENGRVEVGIDTASCAVYENND